MAAKDHSDPGEPDDQSDPEHGSDGLERWYDGDEMRIVLADEISPDSCRLWDLETDEKMDKDRFRRDLGRVEEAYQEVARRLGILPESGPADHQGTKAIQ